MEEKLMSEMHVRLVINIYIMRWFGLLIENVMEIFTLCLDLLCFPNLYFIPFPLALC